MQVTEKPERQPAGESGGELKGESKFNDLEYKRWSDGLSAAKKASEAPR